MSPKTDRDVMKYHADCAVANLDKAIGHLRVMHDKYQERNLPHADVVQILVNVVMQAQEGIRKFRTNVI